MLHSAFVEVNYSTLLNDHKKFKEFVQSLMQSEHSEDYAEEVQRILKTNPQVFEETPLLAAKVHRKIFKEFGPPANHPDSAFTADDGSLVTVAKYFEDRARESDIYRNFLENGKLKYPNLPTINVGSRKKQVLIPVELAEVIPGQAKTQGLPGEIASIIIKQAAMVPADRFRHIDVESKRNGVLREFQNEENSVAFGFNEIHPSPMKVQGFILPYPKLQYKDRVVEPELRGTWNSNRSEVTDICTH
jgi:hypothetical protein